MPTNELRSIDSARTIRRQIISVVWFFGLSLALAIGVVVAGAPAALVPFILAIGPTAIAIALAWREERGAVMRLLRSLTIRPARARWYVALLIPILWSVATVVLAIVLGEPTAGLFDGLFPALLIIPLVVLLPAFTEELAWRGFALPRLMTVMSPLRAAVALAIPWALIHLVLFLPSQWYEGLALWPLVVSIVAYSVLLAWVFVGTGGSVLMAALFHATFNGTAPIMAGVDGDASWAIRAVVAGLVALGVVGLGGLRERRPPPSYAGHVRGQADASPGAALGM